MPIFIKLSLKEIRNRPLLSFILVVSLSFGLAGLISLSSFRSSIQGYLDSQVREIMDGDLLVTSSYPFKPEQQKALTDLLAEKTKSNQQVVFSTMLRNDQQGTLVQVVAVGKNFPLFQKKETDPAHSINDAGQKLNAKPEIWFTKELAETLGVSLNNPVQLGEQQFNFGREVEADLASRLSFLAFLPKVYIGINQLPATNLVGKLSRVQYQQVFLFNNPKEIDPTIATVSQTLNKQFKGSDRLSIRSLSRVSENLDRINRDISSYLLFLSIVALALASLGVLFIYQGYIYQKKRDIAIYMSLGAQRSTTYAIFLCQLFFLSLAALVFAILWSLGLFQLIESSLEQVALAGFQLTLDWNSVALAAFVSLIGLLVFCFPSLYELKNLRPNQIFQNFEAKAVPLPANKKPQSWVEKWVAGFFGSKFWLFLPIIAFLIVLTLLVAPFQLSTIFLGLFLGIGLVYFLLIKLIFWLKSKIPLTNLPFALKHGLLYSSRLQNMSLSIVLVVTLSVAVLNLILQISYNLQSEFTVPDNDRQARNQFILFDIQGHQRKALADLAGKLGVKLDKISPMLRAELLQVNGKPWQIDDLQAAVAQQTNNDSNNDDANNDNEGEENRLRRRGTFNISYRDAYSPNESVIEGEKAITPYTQGPIGISLEKGFADRMQFKLGDKLVFSLLGVPLETQVISIRKVLWTSFEPNFFILFPPGVLEEAPASFIANLSQVNDAELKQVTSEIVKAFPNISLLDIRQTVDLILSYVEKIVWLIVLVVFLVTLAGAVALFSIVKADSLRTAKDYLLFRVLGTKRQRLYLLSFTRFIFLLGISSFLILSTAEIGLQLLSRYLFQLSWHIDWGRTLLLLLVVAVFTSIITLWEVWSLSSKPTRQISEGL